jgi:hypothetical protein
MAELGKTVRVLFQDGQERTFTNALVDQETAGWLFITRIQESPIISGVAAPIAGYRLQTLKGWEYVETGQLTDTSMHEESKENGGNGDDNGNGNGNGNGK